MDRESASRGGKETVKRHGLDHMKAIGSKGFQATVARHWQGDAASYLAHQRKLANQAVVEALADIQLQAELASGKSVSSVELPVYLEPEEDATFWQDTVSRQNRGRSRAG